MRGGDARAIFQRIRNSFVILRIIHLKYPCFRLRPVLHSFTINIQDAAREWPAPNVALHVNVRAHDESHRERQLVVLNSRLGGWGAERRQRTATLVPGTQVYLP